MSAALINRSLTTIRTELEFLHDSEVIDKALFDALALAIPHKYAKDMEPWGVDKLTAGEKQPQKAVDSVTESLASVKVQDALSPPPNPPAAPVPPRSANTAIGYCKALYNYDAQELGDLRLAKDDRVAVIEHLSPDWWKGYKLEDPQTTGVFPANYVSVISETEFSSFSRGKAPLNEKAQYNPAELAQNYAPPSYQPPSSPGQGPSYGGYQVQQQPSYGGYSQFPPPSTNYYAQPPQQQAPQQQMSPEPQQQQQQQQSSGGQHLKKFGSKLGNAAIFGAGATIGSDIVNLIF